jgi:hypothetical protein
MTFKKTKKLVVKGHHTRVQTEEEEKPDEKAEEESLCAVF